MWGVFTWALPPPSGVPACDSSTVKAAPGSCSRSQRGNPSPSWSTCCRQGPGKAPEKFLPPGTHLLPLPSTLSFPGPAPFGSTWGSTEGPLCFPCHPPFPGIAWLCCSSETRRMNQQPALLRPCLLQLTLTGPTAGWGMIILTLCMKKALKALSLVSASFPAKGWQGAEAGAGARLWSCCCGCPALEGSRDSRGRPVWPSLAAKRRITWPKAALRARNASAGAGRALPTGSVRVPALPTGSVAPHTKGGCAGARAPRGSEGPGPRRSLPCARSPRCPAGTRPCPTAAHTRAVPTAGASEPRACPAAEEPPREPSGTGRERPRSDTKLLPGLLPT